VDANKKGVLETRGLVGGKNGHLDKTQDTDFAAGSTSRTC
jgi:hypothetical protein